MNLRRLIRLSTAAALATCVSFSAATVPPAVAQDNNSAVSENVQGASYWADSSVNKSMTYSLNVNGQNVVTPKDSSIRGDTGLVPPELEDFALTLTTPDGVSQTETFSTGWRGYPLNMNFTPLTQPATVKVETSGYDQKRWVFTGVVGPGRTVYPADQVLSEGYTVPTDNLPNQFITLEERLVMPVEAVTVPEDKEITKLPIETISDSYTVEVLGLPEGLEYDSSAKAIVGTPRVSDWAEGEIDRVFPVEVKVTNPGAGESGYYKESETITFNLTVTRSAAPAPAPEEKPVVPDYHFGDLADVELQQGTELLDPITIPVIPELRDGARLEFSQLPAGLRYEEGRGIVGKPSEVGITPVTVRIVGADGTPAHNAQGEEITGTFTIQVLPAAPFSTAFGSSEGTTETCVAAGVGAAVPLVALIPWALGAQINVPGLGNMAAELGESLKNAHINLQQRAGVFNPQIASWVESVNQLLASPQVQQGLRLTGLLVYGIAAGLLIADQCTPASAQ